MKCSVRKCKYPVEKMDCGSLYSWNGKYLCYYHYLLKMERKNEKSGG